MKSITRYFLFLVLGIVSLAVTAAFAGTVSHFIPPPSEFFAAVIGAAALTWVTMRVSGYRAWPLIVLCVALVYFGLSGGRVIKQMIHAGTASEAKAITVAEAPDYPKKDYYRFIDGRVDFEQSGHYLLEHYGDHHYYAFPVVGADWTRSDPVTVWAWARTKEKKNLNQQQRLLPAGANHGLRTREHEVKVNVAKAIENAKKQYGLQVPDDYLLLDWGYTNSAAPMFPALLRLLAWFTAVLLLTGILPPGIAWLNRLRKKEPAPESP